MAARVYLTRPRADDALTKPLGKLRCAMNSPIGESDPRYRSMTPSRPDGAGTLAMPGGLCTVTVFGTGDRLRT